MFRKIILLLLLPIIKTFTPYSLIGILDHYLHNHAEEIVKASTAILPKVDAIGHMVLSTNEILINKVLNSNLDPIQKKQIVLKIIEYTRKGDDSGSMILQEYYNLIDYLL